MPACMGLPIPLLTFCSYSRLVVASVRMLCYGMHVCVCAWAANLMPYLTSYLRNLTGDRSLDYSRTLWVDETSMLLGSAFMPALGLLEQRVPNRLFMAAGWLTFTSAGLSFPPAFLLLLSFFPLTISEWNALPPEVVQSPSVEAFKTLV